MRLLAKPGSRLFQCQVVALNLLIDEGTLGAKDVDVSSISFDSLLLKVLNVNAPNWVADGIVPGDPETLRALFRLLPGWSDQKMIPTVGESIYRLTVKDRAASRPVPHKPLRESILTEPGFLDALTLAAYYREDGWSLGIEALVALQFLCDLPRLSEQTDPCSVCGDQYRETGEKPVQLPCKHVFGSECLAQWMSPFAEICHNTCPMCREEVFDQPTITRNGRSTNLALLTTLLPTSISQQAGSESDRLHAVWARIQSQMRNIKYAFFEAARSNPHVTRMTRADTKALISESVLIDQCSPMIWLRGDAVSIGDEWDGCGEPMDLSD